MLSEDIIASIGSVSKTASTNVVKGAAIFIHEFQPLSIPKGVLKNSTTPPNCLAVSENHVFAAQAEKAAIHVYTRETGNQELNVFFNERITSIVLACEDTVLILGSADGRILLWETASGRIVTTSRAHLQSVTALAVDVSCNFLLSASADSTVHIWSIPSMLCFRSTNGPATPLHSFTTHRSEVTDLALGHSASFCNIAVSISKDQTCLIWDYHTNSLLRTYLLPKIPLCVALDGADRAVYVGYEDGSVQQLNFYDFTTRAHRSLHGSEDATAPIQPAQDTRWSPPDDSVGAALCISLSHDSCVLLTGHQSGAVLVWDVGRRTLRNTLTQVPFPGPVTNLSFLPVKGFSSPHSRRLNIRTILLPRPHSIDDSDFSVPGNYSMMAEFPSNTNSQNTPFEQALVAPCFPSAQIDEGLSELATWSRPPMTANAETVNGSEDYMALDDNSAGSNQVSLKDENVSLKAQIAALQRLQTLSFQRLEQMNTERKALLERERRRMEESGKDHQNNVFPDDESMEDD